MKIYSLARYDRLASNCYILNLGESLAVIDPSVSYSEAVRIYPELSSIPVKYILLTHAHFDHMLEIESYYSLGARVFVSSLDSAALFDSSLNCSAMLGGGNFVFRGEFSEFSKDGILRIENTQVKVIFTPGHTPGSVCFIVEDNLFSGDTLFASGGYGRFDLPGGNPGALSESLRRLFTLDGDLKLYSGHGEASTLSETKSYF